MLTVQLTIDAGKFRHPARNLGLQSLQFTLGQGCARLGLLQRFLELPSPLDSELLFLGSTLLELGSATLRLFEFTLQPGHLVPLLLELGLMRDSTRNLVVLIFCCAEGARLAH